MATQYVERPDGTRIAYDVQGSGSPLVLLHGANQNRQCWHELGYVRRLEPRFTVITVDICGNGESDAPTDSAAYTVERLNTDLLAVADACGASQFALWGFSYGGNIGRYLAATSARVRRFVMIGIPFGEAASGAFRQRLEQLHAQWGPRVEQIKHGTLTLAALSEEEQAAYVRHRLPVTLAWTGALLAAPRIEPGDLRCPTLWLVGGANETALASVEQYRSALAATLVRAEVVPGLTHIQELTEVGTVLPLMLAFTTEEG